MSDPTTTPLQAAARRSRDRAGIASPVGLGTDPQAGQKVPCLFPLEDGARCCECLACQGDIVWAERVRVLEEALRRTSFLAVSATGAMLKGDPGAVREALDEIAAAATVHEALSGGGEQHDE